MNLKEMGKIYNEACLVIEIISDFDRDDNKRRRLMEITTVKTLEHILSVKKIGDDIGLRLLNKKN